MCLLWCIPAGAQVLLDRVAARVNGAAITLTDVRTALALGIVEVPAGPDRDAVATDQLINRQLVLAEVARFAPPEPAADVIARESDALAARAGAGLTALMASTGIDQAGIRDIARDNLRIRAYLDQRFGATVQVTEDEVTQYYRIHPDEFTRNGTLAPFTEVQSLVRDRAGAERRATIVAQWMRDLRARADVSVPGR
ncbi:MAG: hypothetical protein HOP16_12490 [Acidobacteria bacterium]|nr:hypothetical protein [Acidobacteriota bacterium]